MDLQQAIEIIKYPEPSFPDDAVEYIKNNIDEALPELLKILELPFAEEGYDADGADVLIAMFILSELHIKEASPYILRYLLLDDDIREIALGDMFTENYHVVAANVMEDKDVETVKKAIESEMDEDNIAKWVAIDILFTLCAWDRLDYDELGKYLESILEKYPDNTMIANAIAINSDMLCTERMKELLVKAFDDEIVDPHMISKASFLFSYMDKNKIKNLKTKSKFDKSKGDIEDVRSWPYYNQDEKPKKTSKFSFDDMYEDILLHRYGLETEPVYSLKEIIPHYSKSALEDFYDTYELHNVVTDIEDIPDAIFDVLTDYEKFYECMTYLTAESYRLFKSFAGAESAVLVKGDITKCEKLLKLGMAALFCYEDKRYIVVADEIKALYGKFIDEGGDAERKTLLAVREGMNAAARLYGCVREDILLKILRQYDILSVSDEKLHECLTRLKVTKQVIEQDGVFYIIDESLKHDMHKTKFLMSEEIQSKPMYFPPKKEFLKYCDEKYRERGKGERNLMAALRRYFAGVNDDIAKSIADDIYGFICGSTKYGNYTDIIDEWGIDVEDAVSIMGLPNLYDKMKGTSRKWDNRGFTDSELGLWKEPEPVRKVKIGRNDPCPCGSGKKYKKCCGRK